MGKYGPNIFAEISIISSMRNFIALQALPRRAGQLSIPRRFWTRLGSASIPLPFRYEEA
jgi:hypothetical protein